ncbi:MAG: cytochrome P450 [Alphaproteobacteria bacterium]|nr:cytochrome P450 [Alphaproteobacteria bacterium]
MPLPPGCRQPRLIQTLRWMLRPLPFLEDCRARHGEVFSVRMHVFGDAVFIADPEDIKAVFTARPDAIGPGTGNQMLEPILGKGSLILLDGAPHRDERRLLAPPFHGERMRAYGALIARAALAHTRDWTPGRELAVFTPMQTVSLDIILQAVFGVEDPQRAAVARRALVDMLDSILPITVFLKLLQRSWGPWGRLMEARQRVYAVIDEEIARRRDAPEVQREDILSLMMSARYEGGGEMSDQALRDEMLSMLLAGHETSTTSLAWAIYWVLSEPEVTERLRAELDATDGSPAALAACPYLEAVCNETLRIHPMIPIVSRVARKPVTLGGHTIEPGTGIFPCTYLAHRRPETWPEPARFQPERFLKHKFTPYEFIPFGGGSRRCIGMAFALYEMKIVLGTLFRVFDLELATPGPPRTVRRNLTLAPRDGTVVRVKAKRALG